MRARIVAFIDRPLRLAAAALAVTALLAVAAPAATSSSEGAEGAVVKNDNFTFNPPRLVVRSGETVTWINEDDIPHTVASTTKIFRSKALDTDDRFSFTFTAPGVYEYFCSLHPHMKGTIVVEAEQGK
jgi:plastocyanin